MEKHRKTNLATDQRSNVITCVLFLLYLGALVWILLFKLGVQFSYMKTRSVNLIPFGGSSLSQGRIDFSEIILNVVIFIPFGVYAGVLFKHWNSGKILFSILALTLLVESLQFIFRIGALDITDVLTNTVGGILGWLLFQSIEKLFKNSTKAQLFINIVASAGTLVMIVLLVLLKTNNLGVRYQ